MCTGCKAIAMPCRHRWRHWWWKRRKASSSGRSKYLARVSMTKWNKSLKEMECTRLWTLKLDWSMLKVLVRIILTSGENPCHENHSHQNLVSYVQQINILCMFVFWCMKRKISFCIWNKLNKDVSMPYYSPNGLCSNVIVH